MQNNKDKDKQIFIKYTKEKMTVYRALMMNVLIITISLISAGWAVLLLEFYDKSNTLVSATLFSIGLTFLLIWIWLLVSLIKDLNKLKPQEQNVDKNK